MVRCECPERKEKARPADKKKRTLEEPAPEAVGPAAEALRIEATLREATELSEAA